MRDAKNGVERRDRRRGALRSYKNCFIASEFVDWLVDEKEAASREEGARIGDDMLQAKMLIPSVEGMVKFFDNSSLFRFSADETDANTDRANLSYTLPQEESEHQAYLEQYYSERGNFPKAESRVLRRKGWVKEKHLAQETTLTVLQTLLEFVFDHRQELLRVTSAEKGSMAELVVRVLVDCLRHYQSTDALALIFRTLHTLLPLFNKLVFRARNAFFSDLIFEILKECNSKSAAARAQASGFIILLIRVRHELRFRLLTVMTRLLLLFRTTLSRWSVSLVSSCTCRRPYHASSALTCPTQPRRTSPR